MTISLVNHLSPPRLWARYTDALIRKPLKTKAITCASSFLVGDMVAQLCSLSHGNLVERAAQLDTARTARMAAFGLLFSGPAGHFFYRWLDQIVQVLMPTRPMHPFAIAGKVGLDQLAYTPLCTTFFFIWSGLLTNRSHEIVPDIHSKLWMTTVTGWYLWAPAMTINMVFVPSHLRMAYINVVSLAWTNILSRMASRQPETEPEMCTLDVEAVYNPVIDPLVEHVLRPIGEAMGAEEFSVPEAVVNAEHAIEAAVEPLVETVLEVLPIDTTPHPGVVDMNPMEAYPGVATV